MADKGGEGGQARVSAPSHVVIVVSGGGHAGGGGRRSGPSSPAGGGAKRSFSVVGNGSTDVAEDAREGVNPSKRSSQSVAAATASSASSFSPSSSSSSVTNKRGESELASSRSKTRGKDQGGAAKGKSKSRPSPVQSKSTGSIRPALGKKGSPRSSVEMTVRNPHTPNREKSRARGFSTDALEAVKWVLTLACQRTIFPVYPNSTLPCPTRPSSFLFRDSHISSSCRSSHTSSSRRSS